MAIYLALAAGLISLSIIVRVARFALVLVLAALVADALAGHSPSTVAQLFHLL
jgi:hypothetical protein